MGNISALDLVRSHRWSRLFFTSYALSLSFFESVILDAIVRQGIGDATILADIVGVRGAMEECGARGAGRAYEVHPVFVSDGCFHPKILALTSPSEAHLVIGSGNLTFGGWGSNLECIEHLHTSFAADAFIDTADFLEQLAGYPHARHSAQTECLELAEVLKKRVVGVPRSGNIRVFHSLDLSILDQLARAVNELGGAERITISSPFFTPGSVELVCNQLGLDHVYVHAHSGGTVAGAAGMNWPSESGANVIPIEIKALEEKKPRPLHAKVFEVMCKKGRIILSGSANATHPALSRQRNIEVCVARIQRGTAVGWEVLNASAPQVIQAPIDDQEESNEKLAVLQCQLLADELTGIVISPFPTGSTSAFHKKDASWALLGTTQVMTDGHFKLKTRELQANVWVGHQLVLRLISINQKIAQGFISLPEGREVTRRLGSVAANFFAILSGTETPSDVAAVMAYFQEHPESLAVKHAGWSNQSMTDSDKQSLVDVKGLLSPGVGDIHPHQHDGALAASWQRFMQDVLASFRQPRGPIETEEDQDEPDGPDPSDAGAERKKEQDQKKEQERKAAAAMVSFERLFKVLLNEPKDYPNKRMAFELAQFVCDRLKPDTSQVKRYLDRIVEGFSTGAVKEEDRIAAVATIIVWGGRLNPHGGLSSAATVRGKLLRVGCDLHGSLPDVSIARGFVGSLPPFIEFSELWNRICAVKTAQEEVRHYRGLTAESIVKSDFPFLSALEEWGVLINPEDSRIKFVSQASPYCPCCYLRLPTNEVHRLRDHGIAKSKCGKILLCEEI